MIDEKFGKELFEDLQNLTLEEFKKKHDKKLNELLDKAIKEDEK